MQLRMGYDRSLVSKGTHWGSSVPKTSQWQGNQDWGGVRTLQAEVTEYASAWKRETVVTSRGLSYDPFGTQD